MLHHPLLLALILAVATPVVCTAAPITAGERLTLPSQILGEDRTVLVSLPESYSFSAQRYPVLYLTDAQFNFDHTRTSAAFLAKERLMPEVIIIGVTNADRTRDFYASRADFKYPNGRTIPFPTSGHADRFLEFFEKELIPWAEARYRTVPLRILAGQSAGGNFALHAMRVRPALFQAVIAASPWLAWDDGKELKQLVPFLASSDVRIRTLFFTSADPAGKGSEMNANLDTLARALRERKDASLRWGSSRYPDETHDTVVIKSYLDALRMIFAGWSYPRDPQTNDLKGSLEDVKAHYAKIGEQLGCPLLPPEVIIHDLGDQHLRKKESDAALAAFRYDVQIYPESANAWDSLGDALESAGNKEEALASCRKAVSLAEAKGDPKVESYRQHVSRLAGATTPEGK